MKKLLFAGFGFVLVLVTGCHSIGPGSVARNRFDYGASIADSWKQQALLNIVKLRYLDQPVFVDVSSIVAGYSLQTGVTAGGTLSSDKAVQGDFMAAGAQAIYTDRPTITCVPLTGQKFLQGLLTPIESKNIFPMLLAFHTLPLSIVDPDFAKQQMELMLRAVYLHPNGQMPAYEWNFSDVNPPVHAFATIFLHATEKALRGETDVNFLKSAFNKLLLNFTWWVNRKDRFGKNVFEGGFLGLDNIGVFDRSAPLPTGGNLEQADGTAWMALFSQNMLELAVELAAHDPTYEDMVVKFVEHFCYIGAAMNRPGQDGMWDDEDGFYYDILRLPDGSATRLKVRSMVGLLPLCATTVIEKSARERMPRAMAQISERLRRMPELLKTVHTSGPGHFGVAERGILALVNPERLRRILEKMLDENEFLSPYGIRSISKFHEQHPYIFHAGGQEYRVDYLPAESNTGMFGGNSNWRGPIWMPVNVLIIRVLLQFYFYYGDNFKIECPTGSGKLMNLFKVSKEIADRLTRIFLRDEHGRRPVYGGTEKFQTDPHWRDHILFNEYFHADNGAGLGASHQTGWTGVVAKLIQLYGLLDPERALEVGKRAGFIQGARGAGGKDAAMGEASQPARKI
jgi:hypothetical protein